MNFVFRKNRNVISAWSSGTGAAGVTGAASYALFKYMNILPETTLLMMLVVPVLQIITFFVVLQEPHGLWATLASPSPSTSLIDHNMVQSEAVGGHAPLTFSQKVDYIPKMLKYVLPLFSVYLCEYFINQGLVSFERKNPFPFVLNTIIDSIIAASLQLDLIYYPDIVKWLDRPSQYCWMQVSYQVGVFVSRSSLSLFSIDYLWLMSILQLLNVSFFVFQAIFMAVPNIWIIFVIVFWEGLLGGCCYVNTFNRISKEVPMQYKLFGLGLTTIGQSCGIVFAGIMAIPIHNVICNMPIPKILG